MADITLVNTLPASVPTPVAGKTAVFFDTTGLGVPKYKDSAGVTHDFAEPPLAGVAPPEITDSTNVVGVSTSVAREDHTHSHGNRGGGALHAIATTLAAGFLSAADKILLNAAVPSARLINTTLPLAGGGNLSADRTLSINAATPSLPGSMSAADKTLLDSLATNAVLITRAINTTLPLTGGGNLSADRTLGINAATTSLPGSMSAADKLRSDNWFNKAVYNVLDNGISSANSGATNLAAWNALMTAIVDTALVFFPPESVPYDFSDVLNIPAGKHLKVQGAGPNTRTSEAFGTIIRTTNATANIFSCSDWFNEFHDIQFRSSVVKSAGAAILSGDNVGISVYSCNFHEMFIGIDLSGGVQSGNLSIIENCQFTETKQFSIRIDGTNANTIICNCVGDGALGNADAHVELNACGSILMSNCDWIRAVNNVRFNPDSGTKGVFSVYSVNCFFDTASGSSVKFQGGAAGTNVQRVKFTNCWFSGSVTGCEFAAVTSTLKPTGIDFVNCDIFSNSAFGVLATEVQDFGMVNCRIAANVTAGIRTNAAGGSVTRFAIQNNTIGPSSGLGANGIGIDIVAGNYGAYIITGNMVQGNTSNLNIVDAGSVATSDLKQVSDNTGALLQGDIGSNRGGITVGAAETLLFSARIPANSVIVGSMFRVSVITQTQGAGAVTFRIRVGPLGTIADPAVFVQNAASAVQAANAWQKVDGLLRVIALGATNNVVGSGNSQAQAILFSNTTAAEVTATAPTTAPWFISVTCLCTVSTCTVRAGCVESL